MNESASTKRCNRCGRMLPLDQFYKRTLSKDGRQAHCKECCKELQQLRHTAPPHMTKSKKQLAKNPAFRDLQDRELIRQVRVLVAELRARGFDYQGNLTYLQTIVI